MDLSRIGLLQTREAPLSWRALLGFALYLLGLEAAVMAAPADLAWRAAMALAGLVWGGGALRLASRHRGQAAQLGIAAMLLAGLLGVGWLFAAGPLWALALALAGAVIGRIGQLAGSAAARWLGLLLWLPLGLQIATALAAAFALAESI